MNAKSLQSEINRLRGEILQLDDRAYYSEIEADKRRPGLQAKLDELEGQLDINNIDIVE